MAVLGFFFYVNAFLDIYKVNVIHRDKTVYINTNKTAINRPMDYTGET